MVKKQILKEHILVSKEVKNELDKLVKNKTDTYNDIIKRLLKNEK